MPQLNCIIAHNLPAYVALWLGQQLRFTLTYCGIRSSMAQSDTCGGNGTDTDNPHTPEPQAA